MSLRAPAKMLAVLVALSLCFPAYSAWASVLAADRIAGTPVSAAAERYASAAPDLEMASGYLGTVDGRELWSRDADRRRPMASTTKIMSAIVALESGVSLDDRVTVSAGAAKVGQARYNLRAGDVRTVRQLLEEMLVKSGNDAAAALAEHVGGTQAAFVEQMNRKAAVLGLKDTRYRNPHGLDEEGHYTTARDLAALARYAMRNAEFRRIVGLRSVTVEAGGAEHRMENTNVLLGEFDGLVGIKTGMTDDAGWCLVSQAERGRVRLLAVVLGARGEKARATQSGELLRWGFEHYREQSVASAGETMGLVPVSDYLDVTVPARMQESTSALLFDLDGDVTRTLRLDESVSAPVRKGDKVGALLVFQGGRLLAELPVSAVRDVRAPNVWERIRVWSVRLWRSWFGPEPSGSPAA